MEPLYTVIQRLIKSIQETSALWLRLLGKQYLNDKHINN